MNTETSQILSGASILLRLNLQYANGAALAVADLDAVTVELFVGGKSKLTLTHGADARFRSQGATLFLELTSATTTALGKGSVTERYTFVAPATAHTAEDGKRTLKIDVSRLTIL